MFKHLFCIAIFCACLTAGASEEFEKIFAERSKCVVNVQYVSELEEEREKGSAIGVIVDKEGLILVNSAMIPDEQRLSALKDFKVRIFGGDADGYPATYLGCDFFTNTHFLKLDGGLKPEMRALSDFPRGACHMGDKVWGIVLNSESSDFEPVVLFANIAQKGRYPWNIAVLDKVVGANGTPVFDEKGGVVGLGMSRDSNDYFALIGDQRGRITLVDTQNTSSFFLADEFDIILKSMPKNPNGDPNGWIGFADIQAIQRDVSKFLGLEKKSAFVINDIIKDSPAAKSGIQKGDIIVGVDGKPIERLKNENASLLNFRIKLARAAPNTKVTLDIIRGNGEPFKVDVVLAESPKTYRQSEFKYFKRIGCSIREFLLYDSIARKTFVSDTDAPVVQFVKPNSPASSALPAKLVIGDVIKEINSVPVKSYAQAVKELEKLDADKSVKEIVILAENFNETKVVRIKLD